MEVRVPFDDIGIVEAARFDGVTAGLRVSGSLAQTLGTLTLTGTADLLVNGALAQTLGALTLSATNSLGASGALVQTLAPLGLSAIGFGPWVVQSPTPAAWLEQAPTNSSHAVAYRGLAASPNRLCSAQMPSCWPVQSRCCAC